MLLKYPIELQGLTKRFTVKKPLSKGELGCLKIMKRLVRRSKTKESILVVNNVSFKVEGVSARAALNLTVLLLKFHVLCRFKHIQKYYINKSKFHTSFFVSYFPSIINKSNDVDKIGIGVMFFGF
jgi:hypothetical protein